ncbi:hypothetical protein M438DRAFT_265093 [Aureobasidium pullulans EXF-150]|uniref:DUF7708 domain-containing protein n=1 Tax=Aureobasidium pullulans EXF-150 TaxID=1043002 RepID=A0A074XTP7_AURPU|nr:uncharacterized protein M438DRAFT_265093 [Aureobasidium pullulans EXF-150]KEQ88968.1 hypothetical protein M438DRAFT_265093 [Aureobasidium pullulans EXF-150]
MEDILSAIRRTQAQHGLNRSKWDKTTKWLNLASSRIVYYSSVLDALAQHHPEYVSLAWGAIKFVLMGVVNHSELLTKFATAFSEIGEALNSALCSARLYGTADMQTHISELYLQIMRFLEKAVKWYSQSTLKRFVSSMGRPWTLSWKDNVDNIHALVAKVKDKSQTAMYAELRDTHVSVQNTELSVRNVEISVNQTELSTQDIHKILSAHGLNLSEDMRVVRPGVQDLQVSSVLTGLAPGVDLAQVLVDIQILIRRNRFPQSLLRNDGGLRRSVAHWAQDQKSSLLVLQAKFADQMMMKTIMLDLIEAPHRPFCSLIFALPKVMGEGSSKMCSESLESWTRSLVYQALKTNSDFLITQPGGLQSAKYHSAHSPEEWMHLLGQILGSIPMTCLILDTSALYEQYKDKSETFSHIIGLFRKLVDEVQSAGKVLKVVLATYDAALPTDPLLNSRSWEETMCRLQYQSVPPRSRPQYAQANRTRRVVLQRSMAGKIV